VTTDVLEIDWQDELADVQPFVESRGGVVCVAGGAGAALNTFVKLVRARFRAAGPGNLDVQISPNDESTCRPLNIVAKMGEKLGLPQETVPAPAALALDVASNIRAQQVSVSDVTVQIGSDFSPSLPNLGPMEQRVTAGLSDHLNQARFALIVEDCDQLLPKTAQWLWRMWEERWSALGGASLLLFRACGKAPGGCPYTDHCPAATLRLNLPEVYPAAVREQATRDVAGVLARETSEAPEMAAARAQTFLRAVDYVPAACHIKLPLEIAGLGGGRL